MNDADLGGDPPCWAHLLDEGDRAHSSEHDGILLVDLRAEMPGPGGAVWSLPHGGDLDANLVRLDAGEGIDAHVNNDVDVLVVAQSGAAELTVDGRRSLLGANHLALIPKGSQRSIMAGPGGVSYLSIHRRRSPLGIGRPAQSGGHR